VRALRRNVLDFIVVLASIAMLGIQFGYTSNEVRARPGALGGAERLRSPIRSCTCAP
jgi:hypothetical protein